MTDQTKENSAGSTQVRVDCALGTQFETGVITAHPIVYCCKMMRTILATWWYARKQGVPTNKWYGVYVAGTEMVIAHTGAMPGALDRAAAITELLNTRGT